MHPRQETRPSIVQSSFRLAIMMTILMMVFISLNLVPVYASSPADLIRQGRDTADESTGEPTGTETDPTPQPGQPRPSTPETPRNRIQLPNLNELIIEIVIAGFAIYTLIIGKDKGGREWWRAYPRLVILGVLAKFIQVYLFVPGVTSMQQTTSVVLQNILPAPALIAPVLTNIFRGSGNALESLLVLLLSNIYIILIGLFFLFRTGTLGNPEARQQRRSERTARRQNREAREQPHHERQTIPDVEEPGPQERPAQEQATPEKEKKEDSRKDESYQTRKAETILKNLLHHNEEILNDIRIVTQQYKVNKDPEELKINLEIIKRKMLRHNYITEEDIGHLYKLFNHLFHQKLYRV